MRNFATAPMNFYGAASGSDSNDGLSPSTPMKTPQLLWNLAQTQWDFQGQPVSFNFTAEHFTDGLFTNGIFAEGPLLNAAPAQVMIVGADNAGGTFFDFSGNAITAGNGCNFRLKNLRLKAGNTTAYAGHYGQLCLDSGLYFDTAGQWHIGAGQVSNIEMLASYSVIGRAGAHWQIGDNSQLLNHDVPLTVTINPAVAFSIFAVADLSAQIGCKNIGFAGKGTQSGLCYFVTRGGKIFTGTGSASFFPGSESYNDGTGFYN